MEIINWLGSSLGPALLVLFVCYVKMRSINRKLIESLEAVQDMNDKISFLELAIIETAPQEAKESLEVGSITIPPRDFPVAMAKFRTTQPS